MNSPFAKTYRDGRMTREERVAEIDFCIAREIADARIELQWRRQWPTQTARQWLVTPWMIRAIKRLRAERERVINAKHLFTF